MKTISTVRLQVLNKVILVAICLLAALLNLPF